MLVVIKYVNFTSLKQSNDLGNNCTQVVFSGCKSLVLWLETVFYGNVSAGPQNLIRYHKTHNLYHQVTIFDTVIPILMH